MNAVARRSGGLLGWLRGLVAGVELAELEARLARAEARCAAAEAELLEVRAKPRASSPGLAERDARIDALERRLADALAEPADPDALSVAVEERDARIEVLERELVALRAVLDRTRGAA